MADMNIVVVGAGVIGLHTAMALARNPRNKVTIVAKHMPGDLHIEYTSPWAGANIMPFSAPNTNEQRWEQDTWPWFSRLAQNTPEAGVHFQECVLYTRRRDLDSMGGSPMEHLSSKKPWFKDLFPDFSVQHFEASENKELSHVTRFTSVCINTAVYLAWLLGECLKSGVHVSRGDVKHINEASSLHHTGRKADLVVNCTGLLASKLGGVMDKTVVPARGQTVIVRNTPNVMVGISGTDDAADELTYVMQRAGGGGTVLGGCYQKGSWNATPDPELARRIMRRCLQLCPELTQKTGMKELQVIDHRVGLRPFREAGVRLEREMIDGVVVIHNYGHAGYGYQTSASCAEDVVKLATCPLAKL